MHTAKRSLRNTPCIRAFGVSVCLGGLIAGLLVGCNGEVREDRTIEFSGNGESVAFQHGNDGVYVAGKQGLQKIFDANKSLAVSTPRWSPDESQLLFAVAHPDTASGEGAPVAAMARGANQSWDSNTAGRQFHRMDVRYQCMVRPAVVSGDDPVQHTNSEPVELFQARCSHLGYVAANQALAWSPDGKRVAYVDRFDDDDKLHGLFEFDVATKSSKRLFPHPAIHLVFSWSECGLFCCAVGERVSTSGVWIRGADQRWQRIPGTEALHALVYSNQCLQQLIATVPRWSPGGQSFLTVLPSASGEAVSNEDATAVGGAETPRLDLMLHVSTATPEPMAAHQLLAPIEDVCWRADGRAVSCISNGQLRMFGVSDVGELEPMESPISEDVRPRRLVGWDHTGERLALTVARSPKSIEHHSLLVAVPESRDELWVVDRDGAVNVVQDGARITFAKWSPTASELSFWATYTPTHQCLLTRWSPWRLRNGDPAARLLLNPLKLRWMPINGREQAQVGHYYLARGEFEEAEKWYHQARSSRESSRSPAESPALPPDEELRQSIARLVEHQDASFFEYVCAMRRGELDAANQHLRQFEKAMMLDPPVEQMLLGALALLIESIGDRSSGNPGKGSQSVAADEILSSLQRTRTLLPKVLQHCLSTEIFCSLDMAPEGIAYFQRLSESNSVGDEEKWIASICRAQLRLLDSRQAYFDDCRQDLLPLVFSLAERPWDGTDGTAIRLGLSWGNCVALLPLVSDPFLDSVSSESLREYTEQLESLEVSSDDARLIRAALLMGVRAHHGQESEWRLLRDEAMAHPWIGKDRATEGLEEFHAQIRDTFLSWQQ